MTSERAPLVASPTDNGFYTGQETSAGEAGTSGVSRRVLHGVTIVSVIIACACSVYGLFQADTPLIMLPLLVVIIWLFIHLILLFFARQEKHEFHPPAWFIFVSSGQIFIQSLIVIILTPFTRPT
jgi:hypothetical protein